MEKDDLIVLQNELERIKSMGWIENRRPGNVGGVGNTLEDLLNVAENNYQLPDFGKWELKSQRADTSSLLTLFHCEPKPRNARIVPRILLAKYGWPHEEAGTKYSIGEKSFRQTITTKSYSSRGFIVKLDDISQQIFISFNHSMIDSCQFSDWKDSVIQRVGSGELSPIPYWSYSDIESKLKAKLSNLMYVQAERKTVNGLEYYRYNHIEAYMNPSIENFLNTLKEGHIYIDFDARTGHNHGTKFRIKPKHKKDLYGLRITI